MEELFETPDYPECEKSPAIEPFPVTTPAPSVPKGELDTGTIAPSSAFEVFAGKSFVTGAEPVPAQQQVLFVEGQAVESPAERFVRLRREVNELKDELQLVTSSEIGKSTTNNNDHQVENVHLNELWNAIADETSTLRMELGALSSNPAYANLLETSKKEESDLGYEVEGDSSHSLLEKLTAMRSMALDIAKIGEQTNSPTEREKKVGMEGKENSSTSVTYEVFWGEGLNQVIEHDGRTHSISLEQRISALETFLGVDSSFWGSKSSSKQPIFQIVEDLHDRISRFNPANLDILIQKAALARVELEALRMEESKAPPPLTGNAERIEKLYSAMQAWEAVSGSFPIVVQRLKALRTIHEKSAHFLNRLDQIEHGQIAIQGSLEEMGKRLDNVAMSFAENMENVKDNLQVLDERLGCYSCTGH